MTYSNVIATVALFAALGGGSFAVAALSAKDEKVVKKIAKKQANKRINARAPKLTVGHAASADSATNAGHAATSNSATSAANGARRIDFSAAAVDAPPANPPFTPAVHQLLSLNGMTVRASCIDAGGGDSRVYMTIGSSPASDLAWDLIRFDNPGVTPSDAGVSLPAGSVFAPIDITGGNRHQGGTMVYRAAGRTISISLSAGAQDGLGDDCHVFGTAVSAAN